MTLLQQPRPPVLERITLDIVATLEKVNTANGALQDLAVERPDPKLGVRLRDGLAVVVQGNPTQITQDVSVQFHKWSQPYEIYLYALQGKNSTEPLEARLNRLYADVTVAMVGKGSDRTRGGLAEETEPGNPEFELEDLNATSARAVVPFTVTYETYRNNPYRSRYEAE